jgi:prepilin-type N-terminal cleavage/methylation domain-containing protein
MKTEKSGFTLVEMFVSIVILAILFAIIVPNIMAHREKERQAEKMAAEVARQTQQQAQLTPEQLENQRLIQLEQQQIADQQAKLAAEEQEKQRLAQLEQQKAAQIQAIEAKLPLVQNWNNGAYYFPFPDLGEFLNMRWAFMNHNPNLRFVSSMPNIALQNRSYNGHIQCDYGGVVGYVAYFEEKP